MQRFVSCYLLNYFYYRSQNGSLKTTNPSVVRMLLILKFRKKKMRIKQTEDEPEGDEK